MAKLLRYIVHTPEIFMWEQDYCLNSDEDNFFHGYSSGEGIFVDDLEEKGKILSKEPKGRPSWRVRV